MIHPPIAKQNQNNAWFFFTILYLIFDYGRPHHLIPVIGTLRPLLLIIVVLTYFLFTSGKIGNTKSQQTTLIWLFILLTASYIPFARNNYHAYITTKSQLLYMPFILSTIICINSFDRLKKIIFICICLMIYIGLYSIIKTGKGPGNYFLDENDLSLYINMWLPFCYFLFFAEQNKIRKIICLSGLIIGLLSVVVSFSRGGFVGLISITLITWLFSTKKILSLAIIGMTVCLMLLFVDKAYWKDMSTVSDIEQSTAKVRIESWKTSLTMFINNPLGVGGNNFQVRFSEYQTDWFRRGMWGRVAHSLWFTLIPELGIFGIYIYFSLLYYNLKDIFCLIKLKHDDGNEDLTYLNYLGRAFAASFVGYFVSGTFVSVLYYAHYWYIIGLIVAAKRIADSDQKLEQILA